MHPFLLLLCFNIFAASPAPWLLSIADWWGFLLTLAGPLFIIMEGMSSLLVVQKLGQEGRKLEYRGEAYQFALLIGTAVAYVVSVWWIVDVSFEPVCILINANCPHNSRTQLLHLLLYRQHFLEWPSLHLPFSLLSASLDVAYISLSHRDLHCSLHITFGYAASTRSLLRIRLRHSKLDCLLKH